MRRLAGASAIAAALVCCPQAADARTADYSVSEAKFQADAKALEITDFPPLPESADVDVLLEGAENLDHKLRILGIFCKAWKVDNPLSGMVERTLGRFDRDGKLTPTDRRPLIRLRIHSALSTMRCVEVKEMKTRCLTSTFINAEAAFEGEGAAGAPQPVSIAVGQEQAVGVCGGLARGTAISGRTATIALAERLREIAGRKN